MARGKASIKAAKPSSSPPEPKTRAGNRGRAACRAREQIIRQYNTMWHLCMVRLESRLKADLTELKAATEVEVPRPEGFFNTKRYAFRQPSVPVCVAGGFTNVEWEAHSECWHNLRLSLGNEWKAEWAKELKRARDEAEQMRLKAEALRRVAEDMLRKQGEVWAEFDALPPPPKEDTV